VIPLCLRTAETGFSASARKVYVYSAISRFWLSQSGTRTVQTMLVASPRCYSFSRSAPEEPMMPNSILRLPEVKCRVGLSRSSIYLAISQGTFPRPVKLGIRAVGWLQTDVDAWIRSKAAGTTPPETQRPPLMPLRTPPPMNMYRDRGRQLR
jgi:prophage regulatory protein